MSDRELQFKQFKLKCNALCKAATAALNPPQTSILDRLLVNAAKQADDRSTTIASTLLTLSSDMSESYRSFPLLCSRTPQRFNEPETPDQTPTTATATTTITATTTTTTTTTPTTTPTPTPTAAKTTTKKKKKKKKKPPLPAWKRELQERRGLRKTTAVVEDPTSTGETKKNDIADTNVCRRTVAVSYNKNTNAVRWGVSGQLKNQKIHKSIWGKSLIKGRPRGTCAEFHVVNESLLADEQVEDMYMYVSDLIEGSTKPRCRNCLYVSSTAHCFSDDLVFDGKLEKQSKFEWAGALKFKKETTV
jgi:hypothetical protein